MFTKLELGDYSWQSYSEVADRAASIGRGLAQLGLQPEDKGVLYANTCADWMVSALGAFQQSLAVVTIYTNLGEEGVQHGLAQVLLLRPGYWVLCTRLLCRLEPAWCW